MELKPCPNPSCGSTNVVHTGRDDKFAYVTCYECMMDGPLSDLDGEKWNSLPRVGETPPAEENRILKIRIEESENAMAKMRELLDKLAEIGHVENDELWAVHIAGLWDTLKNALDVRARAVHTMLLKDVGDGK